VRIDGSELISPALTMRVGYEASTALDFIAEVAEELLPEHEPNDAYFRLIAMALEEMWHETENGSAAWRVVTYFALWSVRLGGWLPPLNVCLESGEELGPDETAYFDPSFEGLLSESAKTGRSRALSPDSRRTAREMLRKPLPALRNGDWDASRCRDLRRFLIERLEGHFEKRLKTARALEAL
jgi:DNA repair protein RecO (recombination protein O)